LADLLVTKDFEVVEAKGSNDELNWPTNRNLTNLPQT
jgi:hypothetical protein